MELAPGVAIDGEVLAAFCRTTGCGVSACFGSALRGELRPDSDIDLLVEFEPSRHFRDEVSASARVLYDTA